ncbi:hypothetical protein [Anaerotignum sp.]
MGQQYYRLCLDDYSLPGFVSGDKHYFGTLEMIGAFITTLKDNERWVNSFRELIAAYEKYMSGNEEINYSVAYQEVPFLVPAELLGDMTLILEDYAWDHWNVWDYLYKLKCKKVESVHKWIFCEGKYIRCVQAKFTDLESYDDWFDRYRKVGTMAWGHPGMIIYDEPYLYNQLFVIEKEFKSQEEALEDMKFFEKKYDIEFKEIMNDIFGDG